MKFNEAMVALHEGEKVRCVDWDKEIWISKDYDNTNDPDYYLYIGKTITKEWELYEEPKDYEMLIHTLYEEIDRLMKKSNADPLVVISNFVFTLDKLRIK